MIIPFKEVIERIELISWHPVFELLELNESVRGSFTSYAIFPQLYYFPISKLPREMINN